MDGREGIVQKSVVFIWNENLQKRGIFLQFSIEFCFSGCLVLITNSKLVISVGKRRRFARRLWFLIRELFCHKKIARDDNRRNRTLYVYVSFLEFDFLESYIFLENPPFSPTVDLDSQKKEIIPYPRCGFGVCLRCERAF